MLRERLFDRYCRFARALARRQARLTAMPSESGKDLEQLAYQGLLEAIDRFDPGHEVSFIGYAKSRINGAILDGLAQLDEQGSRIRFRARLERERLASLVDNQTPEKTAAQELAELVADLALGLMLQEDNRAAGSSIVGNAGNGFDNLAWREMRVLLKRQVSQLSEPERVVVHQHYENDLLFAQIATMLGLSKGRVSQLHKSALSKLRTSMRTVK